MVWETVPVFDDSHKDGVLSKRLVDFRADHYLPFERVMSDFRKKISCRQISRGKIVQGNTWGEKYPALKKNISLMAYNAEKRSYSALCWGKKSGSRGLGKKFLP